VSRDSRLAALHRALASVHEQIAAEYESEADAAPATPRKRSRPLPKELVPQELVCAEPVSDFARAQAARHLRKHGIITR
jgi:hypothetical protein